LVRPLLLLALLRTGSFVAPTWRVEQALGHHGTVGKAESRHRGNHACILSHCHSDLAARARVIVETRIEDHVLIFGG
jgi:hypothetical protein